MIEVVEVTVELTDTDYVLAQKDFLSQKLGFQVGRALVVVIVLFSLAHWVLWHLQPSVVEVAPVAFLAVLILGWTPLLRLSVRRSLSSNPSSRGAQRYLLSEQGLALTGALHNTAVSWPGIVRVRVTRHNVLFFVSKAFCYFLPRRAITAAQLKALEDRVVHEKRPYQRARGSA